MKVHALKYCFCIAVLFVLLVNPCFAAEDPAKYPSKAINFIIPWGVGGDLDLTGRKLADLASKHLGQKIVCENKAGAGGSIGTTMLSRATPDGYTIGTASYGPLVYRPNLWKVDYNTKEDFTYILSVGEFTMLFTVKSDSPFKTFKEFIEEARKNPGYMTYATPGHLTGQHVFMEQIFAKEKVRVTHVPLKGGQEPNIMLMGGHLDATLDSDTVPNALEGKFRVLAVQSEKRLPLFPDVPTFYELGYDLDPVLWLGVLAPKGVDPRIVSKLEDAFTKAYKDPEFKTFIKGIYVNDVYRNSKDFTAKIHRDFDRQSQALKEIKGKIMGE